MAAFRHFMEALCNPFFITLMLFLISLIGLYIKGNRRLVRLGLTLSFISFILLSTGFIPKKLTDKLEGQYAPVLTPDSSIHWIVVLGGGQREHEDRTPNDLLHSASIKRLFEGVRLYRHLRQAKIILSGGVYGAKVSESERTAILAEWLGIPAKDIVLEKRSINTADQAQELQSILDGQSFYLVTSAIHMPRSVKLFKAKQLHPVPAPTDYTYYWDNERWENYYLPNTANMMYLNIAWHEVLGRVWAYLRSQI